MILQFIMAMSATFAFSVLYNAPKKRYFLCSLGGAFAWISYLCCVNFGGDVVLSSLFATFLLTVYCRIVSVLTRTPVTVYLLSGIFTLVPGAGIYYTAYYLIMSDVANFQSKGLETFKVSGAMVIGIVFGFAIPQALFTLFTRKES